MIRSTWSDRVGGLAVLAGSLGLWACSAENGTGVLSGTLDVPVCKFDHENDMYIPRTFAEVVAPPAALPPKSSSDFRSSSLKTR